MEVGTFSAFSDMILWVGFVDEFARNNLFTAWKILLKGAKVYKWRKFIIDKKG